MKTSWVVIVSAGLGILLGVGTSWARYGWNVAPDPLMNAAPERTIKLDPASGLQPKVVVEVDEFDFGRVPFGQTVRHSFRFANQGEAPLQLESGGTSCSRCTVSSVPAVPIPPGGNADVLVEYNASLEQSDFRQSAMVKTNDPLRPTVDLSVFGKVVVPVTIVPKSIVFSRLSAGEPHTATVKLVASLDANFEIKSFDLTDPEKAEHYDVVIEPLAAADVEAMDGKRGYELKLTVKPGMQLGRLRQQLVLHTNLADSPDLYIPIEGSVDSDISVTGAQYEPELGILNFGSVSRGKGEQRTLLILIRGEHRHDFKVSIASCSPALVEAKLGDPVDLNNAAVVKIPLTVKIPPGSPSVNHMIERGKILLDTNHPDAKQLRVWLQFAVVD
jgi:Protein of unknown function (DUF1573)